MRWMAGHEHPEPPSAWIEEGGQLYCLACRRERAADAALSDVPEDASAQERAQVKSHSRVEFELRRDPDRSNTEVAGAIRSSVQAVQKARQRIGLGPAPAQRRR